MNSEYIIRPAVQADVPVMVGLRAEAEQWMAASGIVQWLPEYAEYGRQTLGEVVDQGVAWIVMREAEVAATVSLSDAEISDREFWSRVEGVDPNEGKYLGKMIVARKHAGQQLGDAILNWACHRTQQAGLPWLCLDARRDNIRLQAYYLNRGFAEVALLRPLPGQKTESGWLAQRKAGHILPCPTAITCASIPTLAPDRA